MTTPAEKIPEQHASSEAITTAACVPNISAAERRKRLMAGAVAMVAALVVLSVLLATGAARWWRLSLFFLFWGAAIGYFQWRDET